MIRRCLLAVGFRPTLSSAKERIEHVGRRHRFVVDDRGVLVELQWRRVSVEILVDVWPSPVLEFKVCFEEAA